MRPKGVDVLTASPEDENPSSLEIVVFFGDL
jgi:hypothetical protein